MFAGRANERNTNISARVRFLCDCDPSRDLRTSARYRRLTNRLPQLRLDGPTVTDGEQARTNVEDVIARRRACRDYLPTPVPDELLDRLVDAARRAPTASNVPYRHIMIVDDPRVIRAIRAISAALLADPPALLILLTDVLMAVERVGRVGELSSYIDSGAAGENVWLLATELGFGSQFTMISAMPGIRTILDIPDRFRVDLIMPVGLPAPSGRRRSLARRATPVHRNQFGRFDDERPSADL
jgi:nitroreductase